MSKFQLSVLIVLGLILLMLLVLPYYIVRPNNKYHSYHNRTFYTIVSSFKWLMSVSGKVGSGKTSIVSGISHVLQYHLLNKTREVMKSYQVHFNTIDFELYNNDLYQLLNEYSIKNIYLIADLLMDHYQIRDYPIYNFLNFTTSREFTKEYIYAFEAMVRNNFVASKTRFFSRVTNTLNLEYDIEQQNLYQVINTGNYNIPNYLLEIIDESSDDNAAASWREHEETGRKQYRNKIRHIHEESNYMISIKQDSTDEVRKQRSLYHTNIEVESVEVIFVFKRLYRLIEHLFRYQDFSYRLFKLRLPYTFYCISNILKYDKHSYGSYVDQFYDKPNPSRDVDHKLHFVKKFLQSLSYNVYRVSITDDVDNIKKESKVETLELVFPSLHCFAYPKYEYNHIQTELMSASIKDGSIESNLFQNPKFFEKTERTVTEHELKF